MHYLAFDFSTLLGGGAIFIVVLAVVVLWVFANCFRKIEKGTALIRTGIGETKVTFTGMMVFPVVHRAEHMDISLKRIEIDRTGKNGLICKDNMRADIKVAFFVRVNNVKEEVIRVAEAIGCDRASSETEIRVLFDAKFSEALKTVGKQFDFIQLYEERDTFREEILKCIGTDLNGFVLDDAAIDYLEQTPIESLDPDNILDAEGIKKITELTANQAKLSNNIQRDKEKVIKQQDVEAREAILELERQLAETEAKQQREVQVAQFREQAASDQVREEENQKAERARISSEEEIQVAEENKQRQVLVALRNKERTDAVEIERVIRERDLEIIERERVTELKSIEKEKFVEIEKKNIQEVIKDRVALEKTVVIEQEKIKDTEAFAGADRHKQVTVTNAEADAADRLIREVKEAEARKEAAILKADEEAYEVQKSAEASKLASEMKAEERIITAEAALTASEKEASAKKMLAEAVTKETSAEGLGQVEVKLADAEALKQQGAAQAEVDALSFAAEAKGIEQKAAAMKLFEEAGQDHEEFKLELDKQKIIELAEIDVQRQVAEQQAVVIGEALKQAKIDIVGGDSAFFDQITSAVTKGKVADRIVNNSKVITDVKETFFNGDPEYFKSQISSWIEQFGIETEDVKNLTVSALLGKMIPQADGETRGKLVGLLGAAERFGLTNSPASKFL
ncbi:flotillin [Rubritalea profundi]|uniref:Flotillin n=2 Tax=Rubritalea profundi TaxID=1658618 RepID=A0A2S7U0S4_9BACT|nr:flotillin [Rubritalea profundi]